MNGTSHTEKAAAAAVGGRRGNNLVPAEKGEKQKYFLKSLETCRQTQGQKKSKTSEDTSIWQYAKITDPENKITGKTKESADWEKCKAFGSAVTFR